MTNVPNNSPQPEFYTMGPFLLAWIHINPKYLHPSYNVKWNYIHTLPNFNGATLLYSIAADFRILTANDSIQIMQIRRQ